MTATPLTLDEGTDVRPAVPQPVDLLPSRRRQREHERSADSEDRIPALAALDAAVEFVLVVRDGDRIRVFSEGGLAAQDADGREVAGGAGGQDGTLPLLVARHEDDVEASASDETVPAAPVAAAETTEDDALFESLLELRATNAPADVDTDELGETSRVPGLVRGSIGSPEDETAPPEGSPEAYLSLALVLEDGRRIIADHAVVFGRSPSPSPDEPEAERVALDSALTDISRNHLEIRVSGEEVVARDLTSTNGTVLTRPGQAPRLLPTDDAIRLLAGDSLNLGGSATVVVQGLR